jgi:hypothetical protein
VKDLKYTIRENSNCDKYKGGNTAIFSGFQADDRHCEFLTNKETKNEKTDIFKEKKSPLNREGKKKRKKG